MNELISQICTMDESVFLARVELKGKNSILYIDVLSIDAL